MLVFIKLNDKESQHCFLVNRVGHFFFLKILAYPKYLNTRLWSRSANITLDKKTPLSVPRCIMYYFRKNTKFSKR